MFTGHFYFFICKYWFVSFPHFISQYIHLSLQICKSFLCIKDFNIFVICCNYFYPKCIPHPPLFLGHAMACGILVPQPGIKPMPPAVEVLSLNHWTTREVPKVYFPFNLCLFFQVLRQENWHFVLLSLQICAHHISSQPPSQINKQNKSCCLLLVFKIHGNLIFLKELIS